MDTIDAKLSLFDNLDGAHTSSQSSEKESKKYSAYRLRAAAAYEQKKIFTIYGNYTTIRKALIRRGWVEKCAPERLQKLDKLSTAHLLQRASKDNAYEMAILSRLVQSYPPNFIWQPKYAKDQHLNLTPFRNRVRRTRCMDFSTKIGLIACLDNAHWNTIKDVSETIYIPSYKLCCKEDEFYFTQNYRTTQCISFLVFFIEHREPRDLFDELGQVSPSVIGFPINELRNYLENLEHVDIEMYERDDTEKQWETFNTNTQLVVKNGQQIIGSQSECSMFLTKAREVIEKAREFRPFLFTYGSKNLWILKPGFQCRGQGIQIMDDCANILTYAASRLKSNYVVQKYIERPFLIHNTKFDIRQYMLLTVFDVISIWMFKDCYLRFSSQEFSLSDLREAIHLTNNSIQKKYRAAREDECIPAHNMWSLSEFQTFLGTNAEVWNQKIYPGFKKNLISVVLSSLEETELTPNSFELYGCDFMLDDDLDPFLIEINSTPDLSPSTPVTAKICPSALQDLLKVVLDYTKNRRMSTGAFELIYQVACPRGCNESSELVVMGTSKELHASASQRKRISGKISKKKLSKKKG